MERIPETLYFYGCDGVSDHGYGCVYRIIQLQWTALLGEPAPTIVAIQRELGITHNPMRSRSSWIEPSDAYTFLKRRDVLPPSAKLLLWFDQPERVVHQFTHQTMRRMKITDAHRIYFNKRALLDDLMASFRRHRLPILIDDGIFGFAIVGFLASGDLRIVDPHVTEKARALKTMTKETFFSRKLWMVLKL